MTQGEYGVQFPKATEFGRRVEIVLATLPLTLRPAADGTLVAIDGAADWCKQASNAIRLGAHGVFLDRPVYQPSHDIDALATQVEQAGTSIEVRARWSSHPFLAQLGPAFAAIRNPVLVDCLAHATESTTLIDSLFGQLLLVDMLVGPVKDGHVNHRTNETLAVGSKAFAGIPVSFTNYISSDSTQAKLRIFGFNSYGECSATDGNSWASAQGFIVDATGQHAFPPVFESADRASWRSLANSVRSQQPGTAALTRLSSASRFVETLNLT